MVKKNNSFTVLRLPVSQYSERVCRHWNLEQPSKGRKIKKFNKKMKNQKQSLQPKNPFSTCTNPPRRVVKTPLSEIFFKRTF